MIIQCEQVYIPQHLHDSPFVDTFILSHSLVQIFSMRLRMIVPPLLLPPLVYRSSYMHQLLGWEQAFPLK